jgi:hypothetical protein
MGPQDFCKSGAPEGTPRAGDWRCGGSGNGTNPLRFTLLDVDERKMNRVLIELLSPRSVDQEPDADHLQQALPED